ncbi:uncharacterized protein BDZ99DRAFT_461619 [Mytilinidion resinicola]|uniref:Uncharacterized protein n=1 Tax=Mytilinidion resinicola TaxID=574789 RepID=A0A6A6YUI2_9PEZI|nr:uncharacterized protein BDZ99DRAFT_461619 [Mytilinidion resinicola]KAF2811597.1 hypothetical protein BDZ99DRAFT_461619 [Mytilinidion resinicola]
MASHTNDNFTNPSPGPRPTSSKSTESYTSIYSEFLEDGLNSDDLKYDDLKYDDLKSDDLKSDSPTTKSEKHLSIPSMVNVPLSDTPRDLWADARDLILEYNGLKYRKVSFAREHTDSAYQTTRLLELIDAIGICEKNLDLVATALGMTREDMMADPRAREYGEAVGPAKFCAWLLVFLAVAAVLPPLVLFPVHWWVVKGGNLNVEHLTS